MTMSLTNTHDHHDGADAKVVFGFWIYVMTDCILFAVLFATYAVLHNNTYGGPGIMQIATLPFILAQSLVLLTSSFMYGLGFVGMHKGCRVSVFLGLTITFILGLVFLGFDYQQFAGLLRAGDSWQTSAFLSSFFSLVGIHGLHIVAGLLWILILMIQLSFQNLTPMMKTRLTCFGLFWNFLNIVWIFIFTIVYLMGAI